MRGQPKEVRGDKDFRFKTGGFELALEAAVILAILVLAAFCTSA